MYGFRERRRIVSADQQVRANAVASQPLEGFSLKKRAEIRSEELLRAVRSIDTTIDPATRAALMAWLNEEYAKRQVGQLLGLFSQCYLGPPYVDHRLSLTGSILEHYTADDAVPPGFSPARPLVRSGSYLFVEVYSDGQIIPVRPDGSPVL